MSQNLSQLAQTHVRTVNKTLRNKSVTSNFYITPFHSFSPSEDDLGYDWFFVRQDCILNGENDYKKEWAHTRKTVEGTSWYIGEGEVCLNYVDSYEIKSYIENANQFGINLIHVSPVAINEVTSCTSGVEFNLGGEVGFETGKEAKGSGSFSTGISLSESYTFNIYDCTVKNNSNVSDNHSLVSWNYSFRKARKNMSAGKWQYLINPAELSHSTFTPTNLWIWKIPTKYREQVRSFKTEMNVNTINTISRYSGSQDCKHVEPRNESGNDMILLPYPPLLISNRNQLTFNSQAGSSKLIITSEKELIVTKTQKADWFDIEYSMTGNTTRILISVKELPKDVKSRISKILILQQIELDNQTHLDKLEIPITQVQNIIKK